MTTAEQFFYDNAGYSHDPQTQTPDEGRVETAQKLARAEEYAKAMGWTYQWVGDSDADPMDWDGDGPIGNEAEGCVLTDAHGEALESLWGIWDATADYARVVEAELALQAMAQDEAELDRMGMDHVLVGVK